METGSELGAKLCAGCFCLVAWGLIATAGAFGLRRWSTRTAGRPDWPAERPLLWYGVASSCWPAALGAATYLLWKPETRRVGAICGHLLLGHFSLATLVAVALSILLEPGSSVVTVLALTSVIVLVSAIAAITLLALWQNRRTQRIAAAPTEGTPPGAERYALYAASLIIGVVGLALGIVYREPHNVRVGRVCFHLFLVNLSFAVLVALGLVIAVGAYAPLEL